MKLHVTRQVKAVLEEDKGLDKHYVTDKLSYFEKAKTNREALMISSFLDREGRKMLANRLKMNERDLTGFYQIVEQSYWW
ncbi:hypothetical protein L1D46_20435 [Pseudoalteromonas sp. Isolate3]|uniref:hypothetical protein n=1 Tax=Pseudoalteromonas sp. Isolate3 TaxID=2908526 RepID=UPI001EFE3320|nr:hypothetical protein [Pseudoalteromonas sp. Isolate3]MCG9711139.1 hypothetical protein [Pseudoalteromonas sp. Isolate3]